MNSNPAATFTPGQLALLRRRQLLGGAVVDLPARRAGRPVGLRGPRNPLHRLITAIADWVAAGQL